MSLEVTRRSGLLESCSGNHISFEGGSLCSKEVMQENLFLLVFEAAMISTLLVLPSSIEPIARRSPKSFLEEQATVKIGNFDV